MDQDCTGTRASMSSYMCSRGELEVEIDGKRSVIAAESTTFFPLGSVHRFAASPNARMRAIFICVPGGLERFFRAFAFDQPQTDVIAASGVETVVSP